MEIKIDLSNDWIEYLRKEISAAGYCSEATDSSDQLSYKFFNIHKRRVATQARRVHESRNLSCPQEHQSGYTALKTKFTNGNDVTPHLSKKILSDNYEDYLLNDWGIHHFHLGESISNGFAERTGPLLFALVKELDIYCIDIKAHGAWSEQALIRTLHEEWPEVIVNYRLKGVLSLAYQPTNDDIAQFRKAGVQIMVQVDQGVVYGPIGGGYSSAGTSVESLILADHYHSLLYDMERNVRENVGTFIEEIKEQGLVPANKLHFQLLVDEKGFHVVEIGSQIAFLMCSHGEG